MPRAFGVRLFLARRFVTIADELPHRGATVAFATEHIQQHPVRDLEAGGEFLRRRSDQADVGVLVPVDKILFGWLPLHGFLAVARGLFRELEVLDDMLRRLRHDPALVIKTFAPSASADLMKIPRAQDAGLLAVILAQSREQHGADRHIDADAERVRAADDFEQTFLCELLDQHAILRQQPGVMQSDAVSQPLLDLRPVGTGELDSFERVRDGGFFVARADIDAREILRALGRFQLREVDHIHGRPSVGDETFERLGERQFGILMRQRHRSVGGSYRHRRTTSESREFFLKERRVAECRGHQEETRLRQCQKRHLPRHAAFAIRVVMELVHDDVLHISRRTFAQGDVRENLRRAAEDGCVAIHRCIAGAEADVVRAELATERHELLIHQRLDRTGVDRALALCDGLKVQRRCDERFARAGGRVENDVLLLEQFQDGGLLRGIKLELPSLDIIKEATEQHIVAEFLIARYQIVKCRCHCVRTLLVPKPGEKKDAQPYKSIWSSHEETQKAQKDFGCKLRLVSGVKDRDTDFTDWHRFKTRRGLDPIRENQ